MAELIVMHHATCARKALLVKLEKDAPIPSREVERAYLMTPEYRKLNADGVVPTLVTDTGEALVESSIIMRYLDETYPGPALQPREPLARARMNLWLMRVDEKYFPALQAITVAVFMRRSHGVPPDEKRLQTMLESQTDYGLRLMREDAIRRGPASPFVRHGLGQLRAMLDHVEHATSHHAYLEGDTFTLADCALTPLVLRLEEFGLADAWRAHRPRTTAWWARITQRLAVQRLVGLANQTLLTEITGSIGDARAAYLAELIPRVSG